MAFYFSLYVGFSLIVAFVLPIIAVIISAYFVINGDLTVGAILSIYTLSRMLDDPIRSISLHIGAKQISDATIDRLSDLVQDNKKENIKTNISNLEEIEVDIDSFSYGNSEKLFDDISFDIRPKEIIVIKGESGKGKSTLTNLLMNLAPADNLQGDIMWNGESIKNFSSESYFGKILKVSQESFIFKGTLRENILLADSNLEYNLEEVLKVSGLEEFVSKFGINYELLEDGKNISGGQKQRIGLARILIRKPELLILDEPTSALDENTSEKISLNIVNYINKYNIATVVISHKNDFDKYADEIIYLN